MSSLTAPLCILTFVISTMFAELAFSQRSNASEAMQKGVVASQRGSYEEAIRHFDEAIQIDPEFWSAYYGRCYANYQIKKYTLAIRDCDKALQQDSSISVYAYNIRGLAQAELGQYDRAIQDYNAAIHIDQRLAHVYYNRGLASANLKQYARAISDYKAAIRIDPQYMQAYNNLAWIYAAATDPVVRDGKQAVGLATKACELSGWKVGRTLGTLAAAYARVGDFSSAVRWQEKALSDSEYAKEFPVARERLLLYRKGKPYPAE